MDFQTILNAVQPEVVTIVIAVAIAGAGYLYQWAVQRLPANAQKIVNGLAQIATQAVEQKYANQTPGGALKKQEAMNAVATMSKELGLTFNEANASAAVESAVYAMNLYQKFRVPAAQTNQDTQVMPTAVVNTPAPASAADAAK